MKRRGLLFCALTIALFGASQLIATGSTTRAGGYRYVDLDFNVRPDSQSKLKVARCPRRTHVYGGGAVDLFEDGVLNASYPIDLGDRDRKPDDGWAIFYDNYDENSTADVTARAICGRAMPVYRQNGFVAGAGRAPTRLASCPRGTFVWGGGASNRGPYNTMNISETAPVRKRKWKVTLSNFSNRRYSAVVYAVCGRRRPLYVSDRFSVGPAGILQDAECPTQLHHVIAGGVDHSAPGRMGIGSHYPGDNDGTVDAAPDDYFQVELENYTNRRQSLTVWAMCLR